MRRSPGISIRADCQGVVANETDTVADTPRDRKPFPITLDTVYMDSCGPGIS